MRVGRERQPEMAEPLGPVARLHLGAQQLLHDLRAAPSPSPTRSMMRLKVAGLDHLAERELDPEGREIILERDQFLAARRFVDAVHHRRLLRLQRARRGDVGGDHIILDQPVRVEPVARGDRHDAALLVEHHPAFGQVEFERLALLARGVERPPAGPQRLRARCRPDPPRNGSCQAAGIDAGRSPPTLRRHLLDLGRNRSAAPAHFHRQCLPRCKSSARVKRQLLIVPSLGRCACGRPSPRGPRRPSASRCPPTIPRAASAPPGRGNRRCCRAPAPRGRARCPGRT